MTNEIAALGRSKVPEGGKPALLARKMEDRNVKVDVVDYASKQSAHSTALRGLPSEAVVLVAGYPLDGGGDGLPPSYHSEV